MGCEKMEHSKTKVMCKFVYLSHFVGGCGSFNKEAQIKKVLIKR